LANTSAPLETGGALVGYWLSDASTAVVSDIVGPGPVAVHLEKQFVPDHCYQEKSIAAMYESSGRVVTYLGDWHTHPNGGKYLSDQDCTTLRRIAKYAGARARHPMMALLAGGPVWELTVWVYYPVFRTRWPSWPTEAELAWFDEG
jgi:integrative and conjugative element protein (TIGR02256 family)